MRIFGYLGIGFLIVWLFAPAPIAMADTTPVVTPDHLSRLQVSRIY